MKNSSVDHSNSLQMKNQRIEEIKTGENLQNFHKISQFEKRKFAQFQFKSPEKMEDLTMNLNKFD